MHTQRMFTICTSPAHFTREGQRFSGLPTRVPLVCWLSNDRRNVVTLWGGSVAEVDTMFYNAGDYSFVCALCQVFLYNMSIIFLFLDGIGIAPAGATNPLADVATPALQRLLGGPLTLEQAQLSETLLLKPIDATLGVAGLPQSGTGHVALLTGVNASALHGRHQTGFPPVALRPLLAEQSLFHKVHAQGQQVAFANVFTEGYWEAIAARRLRRSASVIAAEGAGVRFRDLNDLRVGEALMWDITGEALHARGEGLDIAPVTAEQAGEQLAGLATANELVFFECFLLDLAGHGRLALDLPAALARVDGLIQGLLAARRPQDSLLITSDHGNIEDRAAPSHTRNPVPLLVVGPAAPAFAAVGSIADVMAAIVGAL
jgi:2,3-bisphosphoglycerate-independent phosphoglycerate mutase